MGSFFYYIMQKNRTIRYITYWISKSKKLSPLQKEILIARVLHKPFSSFQTKTISAKELQHEELAALHQLLGFILTKTGNLIQ